jgi:hypothetical protein
MKHAILRVSSYILLELCKNGAEKTRIVKNELPQDAKFIRAGHDQSGDMFLVIESESFRELKDGDEIPILENPLFERVY